MHCPYCQQPVTEQAPECPVCGLQMERLDNVLGMAPALAAGVSDPQQVLTRAETRQVKRALRAFEDRFPQVRVAVLIAEAASSVPLSTWAWWVFNRCGFSVALATGHVNRNIMLVIDPRQRQASLTIGYGLEPFVGARELEAAMSPASEELGAGHWGAACCQILEHLSAILQQIVERMPRVYGLPVGEVQPSLPAAPSPATW